MMSEEVFAYLKNQAKTNAGKWMHVGLRVNLQGGYLFVMIPPTETLSVDSTVGVQYPRWLCPRRV